MSSGYEDTFLVTIFELEYVYNVLYSMQGKIKLYNNIHCLVTVILTSLLIFVGR